MLVYESKKVGHISHLEQRDPKQEQTIGNGQVIHKAIEAKSKQEENNSNLLTRPKTMEMMGRKYADLKCAIEGTSVDIQS